MKIIFMFFIALCTLTSATAFGTTTEPEQEIKMDFDVSLDISTIQNVEFEFDVGALKSDSLVVLDKSTAIKYIIALKTLEAKLNIPVSAPRDKLSQHQGLITYFTKTKFTSGCVRGPTIQS